MPALHKDWRQVRLVLIHRHSDQRATVGCLLEYRLHAITVADQAADPRRALGDEVADLDAARARHHDREWIDRVLRLRDELDRITRLAEQDLERTVAAVPVRVTARNYSERRKELAPAIGLGQKGRGGRPDAAPAPAPTGKPRKVRTKKVAEPASA